MNAFENILKLYLEVKKNYWVRQSVKLDIGKPGKRYLCKPSMPRPEIDLVAYDAKKNELILVEVKSFLDSPGVRCKDFVDKTRRYRRKRYKLLLDNKYQKVIKKQIIKEFIKKGLIRPNTKIKYALAAGNCGKDSEKIREYFNKKSWYFYSPDDIKQTIISLAGTKWEDNEIVMTAKMLKRK